ncbi:MAG: (Fe-S)-binding protein [Deltaproteobacteria bacterium]|nr:(Fe-S)-binding protein [Deltaproteobacteria bacterium]MBW2547107.1 (Fe-S)-binding protein [Deltaproteobacteria bacterium]MBW2719413.1 (Fe-S)-binding protein [Deltaproteobacteria bacterium]
MTKRRLESLRGEMQKCTRCSLCKMVPMPTVRDAKYANACPPVMVNHFHAYSGGGLQVMALSLIDGRIEADEDLARVAFACTTCGLCDVSCKFIMEAERQDVVLALREHIVAEGYGPKAHEAAIEQLRTTGYANGAPTEQGLLWTEGLGVKSLPRERAEVLLYTGASAYSDPKQAQTARKLAELLLEAGVDVGVLEVEPDTGIDAFWTAHREAFETHAAKVCDILDESGVERIVTVSGSHLGLLRAHYPRYARSPRAEVLHASELLDELIRKRRLRLPRPVKRRVTYHDPCYLGRQSEPPQAWEGEEKLSHGVLTYFDPPKPMNNGVNGVYDPPRRILDQVQGLELVEMHRIREYSFCCGGGGGVPEAHPDVARAAAASRVEEARDVGAETIVSACHYCVNNLDRGQSDEKMRIVDLIDLVYEAAGLQGGVS